MADFQRVSQHIFRLEVPFDVIGPISFPVAVWLVRVANGWTLIDTGPPETANLIISAINRVTGGSGLRQILLTHGHYDHAGGLSAIRMAWNLPIACHKDEVPFVTGEADHRHLPSRNPGFLIGRYFFPGPARGMPVTRELERGETTEGMVVIHLPGHAPGHIGFLHPEDQAIICGDAVMNLKGRLSPPTTFATPDPERANASIVRLAELDYAHLLPSHGKPILKTGRQAVFDYLGIRSDDDLLAQW